MEILSKNEKKNFHAPVRIRTHDLPLTTQYSVNCAQILPIPNLFREIKIQRLSLQNTVTLNDCFTSSLVILLTNL